jgi:hypothetical protein
MDIDGIAIDISVSLLCMSVNDRRLIRDFLISEERPSIVNGIDWDGTPRLFSIRLLNEVKQYYRDEELISILQKLLNLAIEYENNEQIKIQLQSIIIQ